MAQLILKNKTIKVKESFDQVNSTINFDRRFLEFTSIYENGFDKPDFSKILINVNKIIEVRE